MRIFEYNNFSKFELVCPIIIRKTYSSVNALHVVHEVGQAADQVHRVNLAEGRVVLAEALCVIQQLLPARETRKQRPLLSPEEMFYLKKDTKCNLDI